MASSSAPQEEDLSSSSSSSWLDRFTNFQDTQRLERLQHCRKLEGVLASCQQQQQQQKTQEDNQENGIESLSPGMRMMKYFGWRGILLKTEDATVKQHIQHACAREQHAVWACRAVSVGCGKELGSLKHCFDDEGAHRVLISPETAYEEKSSAAGAGSSKLLIPCPALQREMGDCVIAGAHALYGRQKAQNQKKKKENVLLQRNPQ
jgi:hypothetical protein